ncbi:GAF domain-containing protein [Nocardia sp. CS682]|uniref:GAF domain-containing protein n=1 Tax=Nocardia sp. CS682 TaxID=1047172 RepID=UPI00351AA358
MPRRLLSTSKRRSGASGPRRWVVVETLGGPSHPTVVMDGNYRRRFGNLTRVSTARTASLVRSLPAVVEECVTTGEPQLQPVLLPSGGTIWLFAIPVNGTETAVYAVLLWASSDPCIPPSPPSVGALEWNARTGIATASAAAERMLDLAQEGESREWTLADVMCRFEWWEDRAGFLALFDPSGSANEWTGTATIAGAGERARCHVYVAARRCTSAAGYVVRALVHDVTELEPPPRFDVHGAALRRIPTRENHAVGLIDVGSWLVHDWIAIDDTPLHRWRYRDPEIYSGDMESIARCRASLLAGAESSGCVMHVRFSEQDPWDTVWAEWKILSRNCRLQAVFDITWAPQ